MRGGIIDVLHVGKYYYPMVGGIEQVVKTIAEGLNGHGFSTRVLAAVPRGSGDRTTINGVSVQKAASIGEVSSVPIAPFFPVHLANAGRTADVLHFHLPNPLAVVAHLALGPNDPRIVVTYHSDIIKQERTLKYYQGILRRFLEHADRIIVTSPPLLHHSTHLEPFRKKCTVVPLSIDLEEFGTAPETEYELPTDPTRPTLLFVGRLSYYKGVEYLIDAMREIEADLLIVGDGGRREALERRTREYGMDDRINFLGKVTDDLLKYCYEIATLFVLPSIESSEAFGIVQLEAMAFGTPVINTALSTGVPWVSKDEETGITVPPKNAPALAAAIRRLLNDPGRRKKYGENARARVERRFDRTVMLKETASVYRDVTR